MPERIPDDVIEKSTTLFRNSTLRENLEKPEQFHKILYVVGE